MPQSFTLDSHTARDIVYTEIDAYQRSGCHLVVSDDSHGREPSRKMGSGLPQ